MNHSLSVCKCEYMMMIQLDTNDITLISLIGLVLYRNVTNRRYNDKNLREFKPQTISIENVCIWGVRKHSFPQVATVPSLGTDKCPHTFCFALSIYSIFHAIHSEFRELLLFPIWVIAFHGKWKEFTNWKSTFPNNLCKNFCIFFSLFLFAFELYF